MSPTQVSTEDKVKTRLEQLELEDDDAARVDDLSQADYVRRIDELNQVRLLVLHSGRASCADQWMAGARQVLGG